MTEELVRVLSEREIEEVRWFLECRGQNLQFGPENIPHSLAKELFYRGVTNVKQLGIGDGDLKQWVNPVHWEELGL